MLPLRRRFARHRGLMGALILIVAGWVITPWVWPSGPKARWDEPIAGDPEEFVFGWRNAELSPDGRSVLVHEESGGRMLDLTTGRFVKFEGMPASTNIEGARRICAPVWMADRRYLVAFFDPREEADLLKVSKASSGRGSVGPREGDDATSLQVWDLETGKLRETFRDLGDGSENRHFTTSADGSTLAFVRDPKLDPTIVTVWKPDGSFHHFPGCSPLALSADGRFVALIEPGRRAYSVWEVAAERLAATITVSVGTRPGPMAFSPDGKRLAECRDSGLGLWEVAGATRLEEFPSESLGQPWFSPDGWRLYCLREDSEFDLTRSPARKLFKGDIAARSDDGHRIVQIGSTDLTTDVVQDQSYELDGRVVDLLSMLVRPTRYKSNRGYALSRDGRWLKRMEEDEESPWRLSIVDRLPTWLGRVFFPPSLPRRIVVHDAATGRVVLSVERPGWDHDGVVSAFSPDGATLTVLSDEPGRPGSRVGPAKRIEVWDLAPRSPPWAILAGLSLSGLVAGEWLDRRWTRACREKGPKIGLTPDT